MVGKLATQSRATFGQIVDVANPSRARARFSAEYLVDVEARADMRAKIIIVADAEALQVQRWITQGGLENAAR